MLLDQNPFFRKTITPWYDSTFACGLLICSMVPVFCFGIAGMFVAASDPGFSKHVWLPGVLAGLSGFLILKVWLRLRYRKHQE